MTQTCETCRYWTCLSSKPVIPGVDVLEGHCGGFPTGVNKYSDTSACSLYRALVSDKERKAEEAVIWAARQQAQADVAAMARCATYAKTYLQDAEFVSEALKRGHASAGPGDEFTEGTECLHEPRGMSWGGFMDTTNTCARCGQRIMRDVGPWREET